MMDERGHSGHSTHPETIGYTCPMASRDSFTLSRYLP